ncbi:hypothetical protein ACIPEQ_13320 [Curtobacterium sp. NPDC087080]|uniref:hypothetical protein n=1 Tax=Curtobacterium sp. NPDC087080 TaxID=3363965 RepID=UPI0038229892
MPIRNTITNPSAEGTGVSLASFGGTGAAVAIVSDGVTGAGSRSYKVTTGSTAGSYEGAGTPQVPAVAGQRWWMRARCRIDPSEVGARRLLGTVRFFDSSSKQLASTDGARVDVVPAGTFRRWTGTADASSSEEYSGTTRRTNLVLSPRGTGNTVANGTDQTITNNVTVPVPTPNGTTTATRLSWTAGSTGSPGVRFAGSPPANSVVAISMMVFAESGTASGIAPVLSGVAAGPGITAPVGQWTQVTFTRSNNTGSSNQAGLRWGSATPDAGSLLVTDVVVEVVASTSQLALPAFHGSTVTPVQGLYRYWTGAANGSSSVENAPDGTTRINLAPDPRGAAGWSGRWFGSGGAGTQQYLANATDGPPSQPATGYVRKTWSTAPASNGDAGFAAGGNAPAVAGQTVTLTGWLRSSRSGVIMGAALFWRNSSGGNIATLRGTQVTSVAGQWQQIAVTGTAPAGTVAAALVLDLNAGTAMQVGDTLDGTQAIVEFGTSTGPYFDGSTADPSLVLPTGNTQQVVDVIATGVAPANTAKAGAVLFRSPEITNDASDVIYVDQVLFAQYDDATAPAYGDPNTDPTHWFWDGAANASTSYKVLNTPKLTLIDDDVNGPRVQVLVPEGVPGTQSVTLSRTAGGRTMRVRGGVGLYAVGGASALDAEVPFGIPVTYQAEQFDATGQSLGFTDASPITVDEALTWVSQPLSPGSAMRVRVRVASTGSLTRPSPGEVVVPEGATVGRIISGQRSGLQGTLVLSVGSPAAADAFDALWGGYGQDFPAVVCIRTPPNVPLPPVLFWACLAPERQSSGANKAIRYVLPGTEVAPPSAGLVIPTLRRKDIDAAYPTRAARAAAYQSRIQRDTDYTKAGLAGP